MIKKYENAGCELHRDLNKRNQDKNNNRDENAHALIIACGGLYF